MPCSVNIRIALFISTVLLSSCGPIEPSPEVMAQRSTNQVVKSAGSTTAAEINRNLAAAAIVQNAGVPQDYRIGPEDLLDITLFNIPEALATERQVTPRTLTVRVSHQGHITIPLLGEIPVKGLTVSAVEQKLRMAYDKFIYNPQVGVLIREFRQKVSVIGAVQKPGVVELTGPKTIIEILAIAGGVTEKAGSQVHVYRQIEGRRESHVIDLAVLASNSGLINAATASTINMLVEPGDMINVPEAGTFFVDGAVRKPGLFPLGRRYSLSQALATAGGVDAELNSNEIAILRRTGHGDVKVLSFALNEVIGGTVPDPQIQPDDVIVVPTSTAKYMVKRFIGTLVGGVSIGSFIGGS